MKKVILISTALSLLLVGCAEKSSSTNVAQDSACYFMDIDSAKTSCKNGQVAVFAPSRWGNEQLPIYAASNFCDFRFSIVQTNGGVSCVFTDARLKEKVADKKDDATPAK
ncbi:MAG: hypothetical protein WBL62_07815 [Gallionella sp.]